MSTSTHTCPNCGHRFQDPLSDRELEILTLKAKGFTFEKIAGHLFLSVSSVKTYWRRIESKFGTRGIIATVMEAQRLGYFGDDLPPPKSLSP